MNVYLSARFPRQAELAGYARELDELGITVTSRWLSSTASPGAAHTAEHALEDIADIYDASAFVAFVEAPVEINDKPWAARGGRHVEFGVAYETGMRCIVVGGDENVFHMLPGVAHVATWDDARALLVRMCEAELDARWEVILNDPTIWDETVDVLSKAVHPVPARGAE